jgi:hypothetical protein
MPIDSTAIFCPSSGRPLDEYSTAYPADGRPFNARAEPSAAREREPGA